MKHGDSYASSRAESDQGQPLQFAVRTGCGSGAGDGDARRLCFIGFGGEGVAYGDIDARRVAVLEGASGGSKSSRCRKSWCGASECGAG